MTAPSLALTITGQTKVATAIATGTTVLAAEVAFGDGNGVTPAVDRNRVTLVNEVVRVDISAVVTDPEDPTVRGLQYLIPADEGGFTIREMGIFDDDGDLIAHGPVPTFEKPPQDSAFVLALAGTVWIKVTDPDALDVNVSIATDVPQSRLLTAGHGLAGGGNLSADRSFEVAFGEMTAATSIPNDASFPIYKPSGAGVEDKHPRVPLALLDRRWRQRDIDLLWYGQF